MRRLSQNRRRRNPLIDDPAGWDCGNTSTRLLCAEQSTWPFGATDETIFWCVTFECVDRSSVRDVYRTPQESGQQDTKKFLEISTNVK